MVYQLPVTSVMPRNKPSQSVVAKNNGHFVSLLFLQGQFRWPDWALSRVSGQLQVEFADLAGLCHICGVAGQTWLWSLWALILQKASHLSTGRRQRSQDGK